MNLKDRQEKLNKANAFIKGGKPIEREQELKTVKKQEAPKPANAERKSKKESVKKKYATYYLPLELIQKVRVEAARTMDSGRGAHIVQRALEQYFENQEKGEDKGADSL